MPGAAEASAARRCDIFRGYQVQPYLEPQTEFFDRAAVPPEISELLDEWPEIDPATARLIRAAVSSRGRAGGRGAAGLAVTQPEPEKQGVNLLCAKLPA